MHGHASLVQPPRSNNDSRRSRRTWRSSSHRGHALARAAPSSRSGDAAPSNGEQVWQYEVGPRSASRTRTWRGGARVQQRNTQTARAVRRGRGRGIPTRSRTSFEARSVRRVWYHGIKCQENNIGLVSIKTDETVDKSHS